MKKNVRDTSLSAYFYAVLPNIGKRQRQVLKPFLTNSKDVYTDQQLSKITKLPINCVTGRRWELQHEHGLIIDAGYVQNSQGRLVHGYKLNPNKIKLEALPSD
jgi:hypothetical protein